MRYAPLLTLAVISCVSSTPAVTPTTQTTKIGANGATYEFQRVVSDNASEQTVAMPLDRAWSALPAVYETLGIPPATIDSRTHTFGNTNLKARTQLGGTQLSELLDCGWSMAGKNADRFEVTLRVTTSLRAAESGGTIIHTEVSADARDPGHGESSVHCASKGALETRIVTRIALHPAP